MKTSLAASGIAFSEWLLLDAIWSFVNRTGGAVTENELAKELELDAMTLWHNDGSAGPSRTGESRLLDVGQVSARARHPRRRRLAARAQASFRARVGRFCLNSATVPRADRPPSTPWKEANP